jgi:hypothetical protein
LHYRTCRTGLSVHESPRRGIAFSKNGTIAHFAENLSTIEAYPAIITFRMAETIHEEGFAGDPVEQTFTRKVK